MKKKNTASFQQTLDTLDKLLEELESDQISLEKAVIKFEEGIGLIRNSQKVLGKAEQDVKKLLETADGEPAIAGADLQIDKSL